MNTLLDMMQTKQLRLYQYQKSKDENGIFIMNDEISQLQKVIEYLEDNGYKQDINLPGDIVIKVLNFLEEYNEIKSEIENIEFLIEVDFYDDYDEDMENDIDYQLSDLQDKLDDIDCNLYNLIEIYLNDNY